MIHFIAGLPRSGSTLLTNILAQNPAFFPTTTSPVLDQLIRTRNTWERIGEYRANPQPEAAASAMRGLINGFYEAAGDRVVFDKHRGWPSHVEFIERILKRKVKIICAVRTVTEVLASLELLFRRDKAERMPDGEDKLLARMLRAEDRCNLWASNEGMLGGSYFSMQDAELRGFSDRLHFVDFERLTEKPKLTLQELYQFIGAPWFEHDFENVKQVLFENDMEYGYGDLHTIRPRVEPVPLRARAVLPRSVVEQFAKPGVNFWRQR